MSPEWIAGCTALANAIGRLLGARTRKKQDDKLDEILALLKEQKQKNTNPPSNPPS